MFVNQGYGLPFDINEMMCATEEEWDRINGRNAKNKFKEYKLRIAAYEQRATHIIKDWGRIKKAFNFKDFEAAFFSKKEKVTLFDLFDEVIQDLNIENRVGTSDSYANARNGIMKYTGTRKVLITEIDEKFIRGYERYARLEGLATNTIGIYLRSLKRVINTAIKSGLLDKNQYPFEHYKILVQSTAKRALDKSDIIKILNYKSTPKSAEWLALQYFILYYLLQGMNFTDIAYLKNSNINNGRISYSRRKTFRTAKEQKIISINDRP